MLHGLKPARPLFSLPGRTHRLPVVKVPSFTALARELAGNGNSYARHMHPDPKMYKYLWWVFWRGSPCDGQEFLDPQHALATAKAMTLIQELQDRNETHWIYNQRIPRLRLEPPLFDQDAPKWCGSGFAVSYEEDLDAVWGGFK